MKRILITISLIVISLILTNCKQSIKTVNISAKCNLVPIPKEINLEENSVLVSENCIIGYSDSELQPLMKIFKDEVEQMCSINLETSSDDFSNSKFRFSIDTSLKTDEYNISIDKSIDIRGGSYKALG